MPDEPRDDEQDRSNDPTEHERRRSQSDERFERERADEHELDLVREQLRRHDRDLKDDRSS